MHKPHNNQPIRCVIYWPSDAGSPYIDWFSFHRQGFVPDGPSASVTLFTFWLGASEDKEG